MLNQKGESFHQSQKKLYHEVIQADRGAMAAVRVLSTTRRQLAVGEGIDTALGHILGGLQKLDIKGKRIILFLDDFCYKDSIYANRILEAVNRSIITMEDVKIEDHSSFVRCQEKIQALVTSPFGF